MLSIFDFQEPSSYLKEVMKVKKKRNDRFTVRSLSMQLGHKYHNAINEMINGKRKVPKSLVPQFIKTLDLSTTEGLYFDVMVDLQKSKTPEEIGLHSERLQSLKPRKKITVAELENFRRIKNPLHIYVAELALRPDFSTDPAWIKSQLKVQTTEFEISEVLERLFMLDILREDVNGKIHRMSPNLVSLTDVHSTAVKEYHQVVMEYAKEALYAQDLNEREFQATAFNILPQNMTDAKKDIRDFVNQFIAKYESNVGSEKLYQLNMQFFGVSK